MVKMHSGTQLFFNRPHIFYFLDEQSVSRNFLRNNDHSILSSHKSVRFLGNAEKMTPVIASSKNYLHSLMFQSTPVASSSPTFMYWDCRCYFVSSHCYISVIERLFVSATEVHLRELNKENEAF